MRELREIMAELALLSGISCDMVVLPYRGRIGTGHEPFYPDVRLFFGRTAGEEARRTTARAGIGSGTIELLHQASNPEVNRMPNRQLQEEPDALSCPPLVWPGVQSGKVGRFLALEKVLSEGNKEVACRSNTIPKTVSKRGEEDASALSQSADFFA